MKIGAESHAGMLQSNELLSSFHFANDRLVEMESILELLKRRRSVNHIHPSGIPESNRMLANLRCRDSNGRTDCFCSMHIDFEGILKNDGDTVSTLMDKNKSIKYIRAFTL